MAKPLFYAFGDGVDTPVVSKEVVGGKGAGLIEMTRLALPVPPGVVIPTSECNLFLGNALTPALRAQQLEQLADAVIQHFESVVAPALGYMPLLSVRSGARVSMPGMMDTILNVGLCSKVREEWESRLGSECTDDLWCRLVPTFASLVHGVDPSVFAGASEPHAFGERFHKATGTAFPSLRDQLVGAIGAVFRSWNSERAKEYRRVHGYPDDWGTAVIVQAMVFGNLNTESCSGVLFTRDPATGENFVVGEFLPQAQGEDVVAGVRTPRALHLMEQWSQPVLDELLAISEKLEEHYREAQDIEFTVQSGKLWILQTRAVKRTAEAAFRIAHDMAVERLISKEDAVKRVSGAQYAALLRPSIAPQFKGEPTFVGIAASPGVVSGPAVFDPSAAVVGGVLVRPETSPDDFPAMVKSVAILTSTGGATSHAAVVARGLNKPAVVGAMDLSVTKHGGQVTNGRGVVAIKPGDLITLDGATGRVWVKEQVPLTGGTLPIEARAVVEWATSASRKIPVFYVDRDLAVPSSGRYYLSLSRLHKATEFRVLLRKLAQLPNLRGVLGFERVAVALDANDEQYLKFLGLDNQAQVSAAGVEIPAFLKALIGSTVPKKLKGRWAVHMPLTASDMQVETVVDAEWPLVRPVRTLADLLAANGAVVFGPDFRDRMQAEKVSLPEILSLLAKTGRRIEEFGGVVNEKDFVNEVLGK